jgi:hypothetical protein
MMSIPDANRLRVATWAPVTSPSGLGRLLFAILPGEAVLLAPPGTHLPGAGDADVDEWRVCAWSWRDERDLGYDHVAVAEVPHIALRTARVLRMLPEDQHGWVRRVMQGQVRDAHAFASVGVGDFLDDDRALACARRVRVLHDELVAAFPDEGWYAIPVPDQRTVDALIAQRPWLPAPPARSAAAAVASHPRAPLTIRLLARLIVFVLGMPAMHRLRLVARQTLVRRALRRLPRATDVKREVSRVAAPSPSSADEDQPTGELLSLA